MRSREPQQHGGASAPANEYDDDFPLARNPASFDDTPFRSAVGKRDRAALTTARGLNGAPPDENLSLVHRLDAPRCTAPKGLTNQGHILGPLGLPA